MNKKLFILICTLSVLYFNFNIFPYSTFAGEDEDIEGVKVLLNAAGDFDIKVEVEGKESESPLVVDATTTFVISRADGTNEAKSYKLYYFFEDRVRRIVDYVSLPCKFKQTYRGLLEGSYEVSFVLKDAAGNHGSCTVPIYVKHKGKSESKD